MSVNQNQNLRKPNSKKKIFKWILVILFVIGLVAAYKFYTLRTAMEVKRENADKQRQVMLAHWRDQGLTEEEIKQKLDEMHQERKSNSQQSGFSLFKMLRTGPARH